MVLYGERFDYSKTQQLTEVQKRVARCRAEAARKGREQARLWRAKKSKAPQGQGDAPVLEHPACQATNLMATKHWWWLNGGQISPGQIWYSLNWGQISPGQTWWWLNGGQIFPGQTWWWLKGQIFPGNTWWWQKGQISAGQTWYWLNLGHISSGHNCWWLNGSQISPCQTCWWLFAKSSLATPDID